MNKKRLYKQNGMLHPRGEKLRSELRHLLDGVFVKYGQFHPRDLALLLVDTALLQASLAVHAAPRKHTSIKV
jgi:hypothetical protein